VDQSQRITVRPSRWSEGIGYYLVVVQVVEESKSHIGKKCKIERSGIVALLEEQDRQGIGW